MESGTHPAQKKEIIENAVSVYYMRVLEIPTPRWSTCDAVKLGLPPSDMVPPSEQEMARLMEDYPKISSSTILTRLFDFFRKVKRGRK